MKTHRTIKLTTTLLTTITIFQLTAAQNCGAFEMYLTVDPAERAFRDVCGTYNVSRSTDPDGVTQVTDSSLVDLANRRIRLQTQFLIIRPFPLSTQSKLSRFTFLVDGNVLLGSTRRFNIFLGPCGTTNAQFRWEPGNRLGMYSISSSRTDFSQLLTLPSPVTIRHIITIHFENNQFDVYQNQTFVGSFNATLQNVLSLCRIANWFRDFQANIDVYRIMLSTSVTRSNLVSFISSQQTGSIGTTTQNPTKRRVKCDFSVIGRTTEMKRVENLTLEIGDGPYESIVISTCGSEFDTKLSLYDSNGQVILNADDVNSDSCPTSGRYEVVTYNNVNAASSPLKTNTELTVGVGGFHNEFGAFALAIVCKPVVTAQPTTEPSASPSASPVVSLSRTVVIHIRNKNKVSSSSRHALTVANVLRDEDFQSDLATAVKDSIKASKLWQSGRLIVEVIGVTAAGSSSKYVNEILLTVKVSSTKSSVVTVASTIMLGSGQREFKKDLAAILKHEFDQRFVKVQQVRLVGTSTGSAAYASSGSQGVSGVTDNLNGFELGGLFFGLGVTSGLCCLLCLAIGCWYRAACFCSKGEVDDDIEQELAQLQTTLEKQVTMEASTIERSRANSDISMFAHE